MKISLDLRRVLSASMHSEQTVVAATLPYWHTTFAASLLIGCLVTAVVWNPLVTVCLSTGILLLALGLHLSRSPQHLFLAALGFLLAGYAFLGKGFAYLPAKPIFVGEIVLGLGFLAALLGGKLRLAFRSPLVWLLLAFTAYGALRTAPYISVYGLDALRDAVIWGYGTFAILVATFVLQLGCFRNLVEHYRRWVPWLVLWLPVACLIAAVRGEFQPVASGNPLTQIPYVKAGDVAVQLAGASCFIGLGLHTVPLSCGGAVISGAMEIVCWASWSVAAGFTATQNRGGLLAMLLALSVSFVLRPLGNWGKPLAIAGILTAILIVSNVSIRTSRGRDFSFDQLKMNVESIVLNGTTTADLGGTRQWRIDWWDKIVGYTFRGPYFWGGKGFGINLAYSDGIMQSPAAPLRSPHDATATILARMGVPGLALWALLQGAFGLSLLRAYFRARTRGHEWWARMDLWILSFWLAFMINGTFDVFLEGPQGGIWFWTVFGLGIAALELQRQVTVQGVTSSGRTLWYSNGARLRLG